MRVVTCLRVARPVPPRGADTRALAVIPTNNYKKKKKKNEE